jgi:uncharacterized phage protein (TIGR02220 family)
MNHNFNIGIATKYGLECAVVLENFYFWTIKNKANNKNFYDGLYWTYNSQQALSELFPYFNRSKIQRIIKKLQGDGLVVKGNYNKVAYDRTTWYALTEKALKLLENPIVHICTMDCSEVNNGLFKSEQPIPDINTDINQKNIYGGAELPFSSIVNYLNEKSSKNYKHTSKKTQTLIKARLNEGFKEKDFYTVIDKKTKEWLGTQFENYLRPETLFGTKFEGYLNQKDTGGDEIEFEPLGGPKYRG